MSASLSRRALIASSILPLFFGELGCGGAPAKNAIAVSGPPLRTRPLANLFPAAGLAWIVESQPSALMQHEAIAAGVNRFITEERALRFREVHGGFDPRRASELAIAQYGERTRVYAASGAMDGGRIERAFTQAATMVDARALDQKSPPVVRVFGEVQGTRAQVLILGRDAVALELGALGPVRAMAAFATAKLSRALPALAAVPLNELATRVAAPVRAFYRGPFAEKQGLGGILGFATGVLVWFEPVETPKAVGKNKKDGRLGLLVHLGLGPETESKTREAYRGRLRAAVQAYRESALGRLLGLHEGDLEPRDEGGALGFAMTFDLARAFDGLFDAVAGDATQIFALPLQ